MCVSKLDNQQIQSWSMDIHIKLCSTSLLDPDLARPSFTSFYGLSGIMKIFTPAMAVINEVAIGAQDPLKVSHR